MNTPGWKLVPEVATPEMLNAPVGGGGGTLAGFLDDYSAAQIYAAMLAAAPSPPPGWRGMDSCPDDGTRVLAITESGRMRVDYVSQSCRPTLWNEEPIDRYVAWMPLPPPPEDRADG